MLLLLRFGLLAAGFAALIGFIFDPETAYLIVTGLMWTVALVVHCIHSELRR